MRLNSCSMSEHPTRAFSILSSILISLTFAYAFSKIIKISLSKELSENDLKETGYWVIEEEVHRMIQHEIDRLPPATKQVFDMTLLDMSIKEIAQALHLSENTVRNQRAQARKILKTNLKDKILLLFF